MKLTVKKQGKIVLELDKVVILTDNGQAYKVLYEDGSDQLFFKVADKVEIIITD